MRNVGKGKEVIGRNEFAEERNKRLGEWDISKEHNLESPVGDYDSMDKHETDGENKYSAIGENQLGKPQYKLSQ